MYPSAYETQATVKLHRRELLREAERDRALAQAACPPPRSLRRVLAGAGRWLVLVGTRLERRYADAPGPAPWAVARQGQP